MWAQPYAQPSIFQIKTEPSTRSQYFFPFLANKPARYFRFSRSIKIQPATLFKARYTACELINNGARACSARKRKARSKIPLTAITTPPRAESKSRIARPDAVFLVSAYAKPLASVRARCNQSPRSLNNACDIRTVEPRRTEDLCDLQGGLPGWTTVAPLPGETDESPRCLRRFDNNLIPEIL